MTPIHNGRLPSEGLTVVGEAVRDATPQIVELSFDVHSAGLTATMACQENTTKVTYIGQNLAQMGIVQSDLKAGGIAVWPIFQLPNPPLLHPASLPLLPAAFGGSNSAPVSPNVFDVPNLIGYRAASSITITVRDASRIGEVMDNVTRAGAIPNGNVRFLVQDEAALQRTLLEDAVREAREKADILASSVGRTTGNAVSISGEFMAYQSPNLFTNGRHSPFFTTTWPEANVRVAFTPGQLTFSAKVSVVYQLQ